MLNSTLLVAPLALLLGASPYKPAQLQYTLRVDTADLSGIAVELRIQNAPAGVRLAAHAHPEYDDMYWRYVHELRAATSHGAALAVAREDSALWRISNPGGDVVIRYRVRFPREEMPRAAWKPFLTATGGLVGGPHSFLYPVGQEESPASVTLELPSGWKVASGLTGPPTARVFHAPDLFTLMESPMLVGALREWGFGVRGVPHRIFYWPLPDATPFDTLEFVRGIERLATRSVDLFGEMPYRDYTFLIQDGAYEGGLEHPNSVTLGALSRDLARNPYEGISEIAHEFVHTWNLMAIKPAEYRRVDYKVQPPVAGLWFSEGLTLFYADLLLRRAGLPTHDTTRVQHLENLIERYIAAPGNTRFSAEAVSKVAYNAAPDALGDYTASSHLQGELIGTVLDLLVRDSTDGARSMDDVMRLMYTRYNGRGFTGTDVQAAVNEVCGCRVDAFFESHVRGAGAIDFARYLAPFGLTVSTSWSPAVREDGQPVKDLRFWAWQPAGEALLRVRLSDPASVWGQAGLRTGDQLVSINGTEVRSWPELRTFLTRFAIGDSATFLVRRDDRDISARVVMRGFDEPSVHIQDVRNQAARQRRLLAAWRAGR